MADARPGRPDLPATAEWPPIAVLGAGAVGCYFGGMLARAGAPVTLIGRAQHVEAINRNGLCLESVSFLQHIPIAASTEVAAVQKAQVVLLCVKATDTHEAAQALAPQLASDAVVVSLQNGVENAERIRSVIPRGAVPAVVYVGVEMIAPGWVKHSARGDLVLGRAAPADEGDGTRGLAALFERAGVPCRVSDRIEVELWTKLIMNCAYNAIAALGRARYGRIANDPWTRDIVRQVVEETVAVARAAGIPLDNQAMLQATWKLAATMPETSSSTAQDIQRHKRTEIDALNGYVARRGAELGIATPVNRTLHALVKLLEQHASGS